MDSDPRRKTKYTARINGGQQFSGVYERIEAWINTVPGAHFDPTQGVSWIDGQVFYTGIILPSEVDLLALKLAFAGSVVQD